MPFDTHSASNVAPLLVPKSSIFPQESHRTFSKKPNFSKFWQILLFHSEVTRKLVQIGENKITIVTVKEDCERKWQIMGGKDTTFWKTFSSHFSLKLHKTKKILEAKLKDHQDLTKKVPNQQFSLRATKMHRKVIATRANFRKSTETETSSDKQNFSAKMEQNGN